MARLYQVPSHARPWLTAAILAISLPQLLRGPFWQVLLLLAILLWRALMDRQRAPLPGRWIRVLLLLGTVGGIYLSFGRLIGPEAGTALITSLFALKYLELVGRRDAYVLIIIGYFVCATILLFQQGFFVFLYVCLCLLLLTASLVGIHYNDSQALSRQHLGKAAVLLLQAVPLAVVLFVLVPRLPPLWNVHTDQGQARTGMSDTMAPGQVSNLAESSAIAFRVQFDGEVPPYRQRYWRGLTYSWFDGRTWSQARPDDWGDELTFYSGRGTPPLWYRDLLRRAADRPYWDYQVIMAPSQRRWLYALNTPVPEFDGLVLARDRHLVATEPVTGNFRYRVRSYTGVPMTEPLAPDQRALMLSLPEQGFPRARELASQWRRQYRDDSALVSAALHWFRDEPFHYTLSPPAVGPDVVDGFLFNTRRGFCEHYASSFVVLMRAAGIPSRVVGGYQGGEANPMGRHLLIRQYDAHAWAEVWLPGRGWVEVDPTGAVAPERVELGLRGSLSQAGEVRLPGDGIGRLPVLFQLRQWADLLEFRWQSWVLGYDLERQNQWLSRWLGAVTPWRLALLLLTLAALLVLATALIMFRGRGPRSATPLTREYRRLARGLSKRGVRGAERLSAAQLCERIARRWPAAEPAALSWRETFERLAYQQDTSPSIGALRALRRQRRRLMKACR